MSPLRIFRGDFCSVYVYMEAGMVVVVKWGEVGGRTLDDRR